MSDPAIAKIEDALAAQLRAWSGLAGYTVQADPNESEAAECGSDKVIRVYTVTWSVDQSDEQGQTIHTATIEFEAVNATQSTGSISRANQVAIAHIIAAIASDRSVGGRLQDIQEVDVASSGANMRDADAASLQTTVQFFTPRDDWFTIVGVGGDLF
jgi:hypothetical protein